jgi:hypothetical protein
MSKKLYIYSAILAIVYVAFFGNCVYEMMDSAIGGAKFGTRAVESGNISIGTHYEVLGAKIKPSSGTASFASTILNEKTGETMKVEYREIMTFLTDLPESVPASITALKYFNFLLTFCLLVIFVYLPFVAYKTLRSISKDEFYTLKNINNIRKISIAILIMFLINLLSNIFMNIVSDFYMQIEGYKTIVRNFNFPVLFLGLVLLIMSEILRYTTIIKEEQELTV